MSTGFVKCRKALHSLSDYRVVEKDLVQWRLLTCTVHLHAGNRRIQNAFIICKCDSVPTVPFRQIFYLHIHASLSYRPPDLGKYFSLRRDRGRTVVEVLCYKLEGRWFDPSWCQWIFH